MSNNLIKTDFQTLKEYIIGAHPESYRITPGGGQLDFLSGRCAEAALAVIQSGKLPKGGFSTVRDDRFITLLFSGAGFLLVEATPGEDAQSSTASVGAYSFSDPRVQVRILDVESPAIAQVDEWSEWPTKIEFEFMLNNESLVHGVLMRSRPAMRDAMQIILDQVGQAAGVAGWE